MDFNTIATASTSVLSDVILPHGGALHVTHGKIQFGTHANTNPTQLRLWTHGDTVCQNDLHHLSMRELTDMLRSTRNISAQTISLVNFVKHEMSPSVRLLHVPHASLPEMWTAFFKEVDAPLGSTAADVPYESRTEMLVVHQTPAHFLSDADLVPLLHRDNVVVLLVADEPAAAVPAAVPTLFSDTLLVQLRFASHALAVRRLPRCGGLVSLRHVLDALLQCAPLLFQSCQAPKENLALIPQSTARAPCFLVNRDETVFLGMTHGELKPIARSVSLFHAYHVLALGDASVALGFSTTSSLHTEYGACAVGVVGPDTGTDTLRAFLAAFPNAEQAVARTLLYEVAKLQPPAELLHVLTPFDTLVRHEEAVREDDSDGKAACLGAAIDALRSGTGGYRNAERADAIRSFFRRLKQYQKVVYRDQVAVGLMAQALSLLSRIGDWCLSEVDPRRQVFTPASALASLYGFGSTYREACREQYTLPEAVLDRMPAPFHTFNPARQVSQAASYTDPS